MKKISIILIFVGLLFVLYPFVDRLYTLYWNNKLINQWNEDLSTVELNPSIIEDSNRLQDIFNEDSEEEEDVQLNKDTINESYNTIGILEIKKIDLKLPILEGINNLALKRGAGWMPNTAFIGEEGNSVISAHRSHTYGRFFNRLDELEEGDEIIITSLEKQYKYTVYSKKIVHYTDISVLYSSEGEYVLTLITCHPLYKRDPQERLIVQCKFEI